MKEDKKKIDETRVADSIKAKNECVFSFDLYANEKPSSVRSLLKKLLNYNNPYTQSLKFSIRTQSDNNQFSGRGIHYKKRKKSYYILYVTINYDCSQFEALKLVMHFLVEKINLMPK